MAATALLNSQPTPDDQAIDAAMAGNLCRCATYTRIRTATLRVAVQFCHVEMSLMVCQVSYLRSAECGRVGKVLSGNQVCLASKAPLSRRGMTAEVILRYSEVASEVATAFVVPEEYGRQG